MLKLEMYVRKHIGLHGGADGRSDRSDIKAQPKFLAFIHDQILLPMVLRARLPAELRV